nr:MAG TPA: hypothetical protein [Caudoviricetes sp.]
MLCVYIESCRGHFAVNRRYSTSFLCLKFSKLADFSAIRPFIILST